MMNSRLCNTLMPKYKFQGQRSLIKNWFGLWVYVSFKKYYRHHVAMHTHGDLRDIAESLLNCGSERPQAARLSSEGSGTQRKPRETGNFSVNPWILTWLWPVAHSIQSQTASKCSWTGLQINRTQKRCAKEALHLNPMVPLAAMSETLKSISLTTVLFSSHL